MKLSDWRDVTPYMLYCCLAFSVGNILFGLDVASFGSLQALPSFLRQFGELQPDGAYNLSTNRKSIMNSVNWIGKLVGCAIFEPLVERFGFKKTIYVMCSVQLVAVTVELTSKTWIQFCVGRVLAYLAVGIAEPVVPTYQAEISPAALRGFFAGNAQLIVHFGSIWGSGMSYAFANETENRGWMIPVSMQMIPAGLLLMMIPWCIESPRWLVTQDRKDDALQDFSLIRPKECLESGQIAAEIDAFQQAVVESREQNNGAWKDLFTKTYIHRTLVVAVMFFFQQSTGNQFANTYGPTFFESMGLPFTRLFTYSILIPLFGLLGCLFAVLTTDTIGRRTLCYAGAALCVMFSALIGSIGSKPHAYLDETYSNVVIASVILLNFSCKLGVSSQCWLIGSEIGGTQMRKKLMGWGVIIDVLSAFLVTFCTPYLMDGTITHIGAKMGYVIMGLAALCFFFSIFFIPDLKGRSLEEVDELFEVFFTPRKPCIKLTFPKRKLWAWQFSKAETYGVGSCITALGEGRFPKMDLEGHAQHVENL